MKLRNFEIENFRSITKTTCDVSQDITIFAGKNESGKTTILEALKLLNGDVVLNEDDKPSNLTKDAPTIITCTFELGESELNRLAKKFGVEAKNSANLVTIRYSADDKKYQVSGTFFDYLVGSLKGQQLAQLDLINSKIAHIGQAFGKEGKTFLTETIPNLDETTLQNSLQSLTSDRIALPVLTPTEQNPQPKPHPLIAEIDSLMSKISALTNV